MIICRVLLIFGRKRKAQEHSKRWPCCFPSQTKDSTTSSVSGNAGDDDEDEDPTEESLLINN